MHLTKGDLAISIMGKDNTTEIESLAKEISDITSDLKYSAAIEIIYSGFLFNKYIEVLLSAYNISAPRLQVLLALAGRGEALKPKDLTRLTFHSKQNLSGIINNLLKDGLASKQQDPRDRRSFKIAITRKGMGLVKASLPIIAQAARSIILQDDKTTRVLKADLKAIRQNLYTALGKR
jgi:DNA-binding MarR family transcriptional regulator